MAIETSRDLDARVAERVMGWCQETSHITPKATVTSWRAPAGTLPIPYLLNFFGDIPLLSADPAAARLVEDEIERRGLWRAYTEALLLAVIDLPPGVDTIFEGWALIRATPEQRCRAALAAVEG